jgi:2-polyprenyl-3-methyl-5-hydroxy-6-metoxy-1,4-benzoquinol methylase
MSTGLIEKFNIPSYFNIFRQDIVDVVPVNAKWVLSVGCAAGVTEAELIKRGINVIGVEINPKAAEIARQRGLIVLEGDASEVNIGSENKIFDCLIYADVMEHLPDPQEVLKKHILYLKPGGIVYLCIPNFRHWSVLWQLFFRGHIEYVDAGILDRTHLRITTRKMALKWLEEANIEVMNVKHIIHGRKNKIISGCLLGLAKEFIAEQISIVGKKPGYSDAGKK